MAHYTDNLVNISGVSKYAFRKAIKLCMCDKKAIGFVKLDNDRNRFQIISENHKGYIENFNEFPYPLTNKQLARLFYSYFEIESEKLKNSDFYLFFNIQTSEKESVLLNIVFETDYLNK